MTPKAKLLISTCLLPSLADMLEDSIESGLIRFQAKHEATKVIKHIRSLDEFLMNEASIEDVDQEILIQRVFRRFINEHFEE